jgi:hypothetical protein
VSQIDADFIFAFAHYYLIRPGELSKTKVYMKHRAFLPFIFGL